MRRSRSRDRDRRRRYSRSRSRDRDEYRKRRRERDSRDQYQHRSSVQENAADKRSRRDERDRSNLQENAYDKRREKEEIVVVPIVPKVVHQVPNMMQDVPFYEQHEDEKEDELDEEEYLELISKEMEEIENAELLELEEDRIIRERRERLAALAQPVEPNREEYVPIKPEVVQGAKPLAEILDQNSNVNDENREIVTKESKVLDIFSQSPVDDDMFCKNEIAEDGSKVIIPVSAVQADNYADEEGYYNYRAGDIIAERYEVFGVQGKGVFSSVLKVRDLLGGNKELVVKIIRNNEIMYKAGMKEIGLMTLLAEKDPENRNHIVRLYSNFEHREHLCLVFEPMYMNLRELLKKFGGEGLSMDGVCLFARQLFIALRHLKRANIIHADLKPDNILVNEKMNMVKVCDLGSAMKSEHCEPTPLLVSRFYRAPEIIIGFPYGFPIDVWSIGCVLYELYTGKIMFEGADNNDMLRLQMELNGLISKKLLRKSIFASEHFDSNGLFERTRVDLVSGIEIQEKYQIKVKRNILDDLKSSSGVMTAEQFKKVRLLSNLISRCVELDPGKRITPDECLKHAIFSSTSE